MTSPSQYHAARGIRVPHPMTPNMEDSRPTVAATAITNNLSDSVFLTTELCENVMSYLPFKDLLLAQRVCRKWQAVIGRSRPLQKALFLIPREDPEFCWMFDHDFKAIPGVHPHYNFLTKVESNYQVAPDDAAHISLFASAEFCPVLEPIWRLPFLRSSGPVELSSPVELKRSAGVMNPKASWRHMLLCQPPVKIFGRRSYQRGFKYGPVKCKEFATMADVVSGVKVSDLALMKVTVTHSGMLFPMTDELKRPVVYCNKSSRLFELEKELANRVLLDAGMTVEDQESDLLQ